MFYYGCFLMGEIPLYGSARDREMAWSTALPRYIASQRVQWAVPSINPRVFSSLGLQSVVARVAVRQYVRVVLRESALRSIHIIIITALNISWAADSTGVATEALVRSWQGNLGAKV